MTATEFSEQFDALLANHAGVIVLDEYEKSLFLTMAQESVVKDFYNGSKPYELTEESRRALSRLTTTKVLNLEKTSNFVHLKEGTYVATMPDDLFFIVYEQATIKSEDKCIDKKIIPVVPTSADVFYKTNANPFRGPSKSRALRLDTESNTIEIVSNYELSEYTIRYVRKPYPILLTDLSKVGLTINGYSEPLNESGCELEESTHMLILMKAVELAVSLRAPKSEPQPKQSTEQ